MARRLLTTLSVASLALCATTCVLWAWNRGGPPWDEVYAVRPGRSCGVGMEPGGVIGFPQRERPDYREGDPDDRQVRWGGFRFLRVTGDGVRRWNLAVPAWLPAAAALALPGCRVAAAVRAGRRRGRGLCPACGYDLRATPGRCPECGANPVAPAKGDA